MLTIFLCSNLAHENLLTQYTRANSRALDINMATLPPSLGLFGLLPQELRDMVCEYFMPWNFRRECHQNWPGLSLFRVSQAIHAETVALLYKD